MSPIAKNSAGMNDYLVCMLILILMHLFDGAGTDHGSTLFGKKLFIVSISTLPSRFYLKKFMQGVCINILVTVQCIDTWKQIKKIHLRAIERPESKTLK